MPVTLKSVAKNYTYNTNYDLDARRFQSIIKVLEESRDNLNKPQVAHIDIQVDDPNFDNTQVNSTLTKVLAKQLNTGFGYFLALECSEYSKFHIHIMLTFSTGSSLPFTVLKESTKALLAIDGVNNAIALPRKQDRSVPIDTSDYYKQFKNIDHKHDYFHNLKDESQLKDAVHRYSYLSKDQTKTQVEALKDIRLTQSKIPKASKTKQGQTVRKNKKLLGEQ